MGVKPNGQTGRRRERSLGAQAVKLIAETGCSHGEAARHFGLTRQAVSNYLKRNGTPETGNGPEVPLEAVASPARGETGAGSS